MIKIRNNKKSVTTKFEKAKIDQNRFGRLTIIFPAKRISKKPNSSYLAEKRPNWQP